MQRIEKQLTRVELYTECILVSERKLSLSKFTIKKTCDIS